MNKKYVLYFVILASQLCAQNVITGWVYNDANKNAQKDRKEQGLASVAVSNGVEVVLTDKEGKYSLPIHDNQTVFVIKPEGYQTNFNGNFLPKFYYHHKPEGSPTQFKYKGTSPTGKLPKELNFPLYQQKEEKNFDVLVLGDPQPYTEKELDFFRRGIVNEIKSSNYKAKFGISLGDLVGDNLDLQPKYISVMKEIGLPWYNVMGNHDMNYEAKEDQLSDETFEENFGPANYAFNYGNVHFMILDDIFYPDPRDQKGYWGGFRKDQLDFIENNLKLVDKNKLVVVSLHIPLYVDNGEDFRDEDRKKLLSLLSPFRNVLILSAHTHLQQQIFYGKEQGWTGQKKAHEYNVGTTSGDWYSGTVDKIGVPQSTMRDGTPRGYSIISFSDDSYKVKYKVAGEDESYQIQLHVPEVIPFQSKNSARIFANFFMGSVADKVEFRIDNGEWQKMSYTKNIDPTYMLNVFKWDTTQQLFPGRRPSNPEASTHLWSAGFPKGLNQGDHKVEVRAYDQYGNEFSSTKMFTVQKPVDIQ